MFKGELLWKILYLEKTIEELIVGAKSFILGALVVFRRNSHN